MDHRDLKPENLVFIERGKYKETHLAVIDFSLTKAPKTDVNAGTPGYLDPFLPDRPDRRWDLHAERYAAGVVLTELATGERPSWGGGADPRSTDLDLPDLREDMIDPAIREPLVALLQQLCTVTWLRGLTPPTTRAVPGNGSLPASTPPPATAPERRRTSLTSPV